MKKKLIVYDFDKTIYSGESGTNFFNHNRVISYFRIVTSRIAPSLYICIHFS